MPTADENEFTPTHRLTVDSGYRGLLLHETLQLIRHDPKSRVGHFATRHDPVGGLGRAIYMHHVEEIGAVDPVTEQAETVAEFSPTHRLRYLHHEWPVGTEVVITRDAPDKYGILRVVNSAGTESSIHSSRVEPITEQPEPTAEFVPTHELIVSYSTHSRDGWTTWPVGYPLQLLPVAGADGGSKYVDSVGVEGWVKDTHVREFATPEPVEPAEAEPVRPVVGVRVQSSAQLTGDGPLTADTVAYALSKLPVAGDQQVSVVTTTSRDAWRIDVTWVNWSEQ